MDEIDSIGSSRLESGSGGDSEVQRTMLELLNQLDGFEVVDDTVVAEFTPRPDYQGFGGVLHGGVLATALDEILAWSAILIAGSPAVTAKPT